MPLTEDLTTSLTNAAALFDTEFLGKPTAIGINESEKHWLEELSKIYLCTELDIELPEHPDEKFTDTLKRVTQYGADSALLTRMVMFAATIVCEPDFLTNSSTYMSTLEHHRNHWNQQYIEASHVFKHTRPLDDFIADYFADPRSVPELELSYYLTLYFRHFYRFLNQFMLFYIEKQSPVYYGRSNT